MDLPINQELIIPGQELEWRFSKASGPGGQNVNKTETRVELMINIKKSQSLSSEQKQKILKVYQSRIKSGYLSVISCEERSQYQNRLSAMEKISKLIKEGIKNTASERKPTRPTLGSINKRIAEKKKRGMLKEGRNKNLS